MFSFNLEQLFEFLDVPIINHEFFNSFIIKKKIIQFQVENILK